MTTDARTQTDTRQDGPEEAGVDFTTDRPARRLEDTNVRDEAAEVVDPGRDARERAEVHGPTAETAPGRLRHDPEALRAPEVVGGTVPAVQGWRGRLNTLGWRLAPGPEELARRAELAQIAQPFSRTMTVMVANPKGSTGKTPTALGLAGALAVPRGDGIAAWDNNECRGNMHVRTHAHGATATVRDMLAEITFLESPAANASHVRAFLRRQVAGQYDVLVSQSEGGTLIGAEAFDRVRTVLSRYYSVLVVDTGNSEAAATWRATRDAADALVVPTPWAPDGCYAAAQMLKQLQDDGFEDLVTGAIIVATGEASDYDTATRTAYLPYFQARARAVVEIPVDAHIHAKGVIEHDALAKGTRQAYTALAAQVVALLRDVDRTTAPHISIQH